MSQPESFEKIRPEPKPKTVPSTEKNDRKASIFSNMLDWLGNLILNQTKKEGLSDELQTFTRHHEISLKKVQLSQVEENAKRAILNLEATKARLHKKYGQSASGFIAKCLDPKILHIHELIAKLAHSAQEDGDSFQNFLHHAIEYVQYYQELDEQKLKRRIIQDAQTFILQAIDKDLEVLVNYKMHVLDSLVCSEEERNEREALINRFTLPVLVEIGEIANFNFEGDDLEAFFTMKTMIDDRRNSLVELGLLTIDALTCEYKPQAHRKAQNQPEYPQEEYLQEELELETLHYRDPNEDVALTLSFLSLLESRMQDFFALLEHDRLDAHSISMIDKLLCDLKNDSMRFLSYKIDNQEVQDTFKNFQEGLSKAEHLLNKHKQHNAQS